MAEAFEEALARLAEGFRRPGDPAALDEEARAYAEQAVAALDLDGLRGAYPDLEDAVPELRGMPPSHPAFYAAIEMAVLERIMDPGRGLPAP